MNRENILFGIIGILFGTILGFVGTNAINSKIAPPAAAQTSPMATTPVNTASGEMPAGHPDISNMQMPAEKEPSADLAPALEAAKKDPNNFDAQFKVAEIYAEAQKYEEATEYLEKANKIKPDDYTTIVNLGNVGFDAGNFEQAEKWYTTALTKKPEDLSVRTDMGLIFIFRKNPDFDRAIKEFTTVLSADPNHKHALQNITVAYIRKGDAAKARESVAKLEAVSPGNSDIKRLKEDTEKIGK